MSDLQFHPLANLFPLMEGADFRDLVADVRQHGLREPVVIHDGMILDGRNRFRACQAAGVPARLVPFEGGDPTAFVVSLNLRRRHLDESQRATVAAKIANMRQGERTDIRPAANLQNVPELPGIPEPVTAAPISIAKAAEMLNVSPRTVAHAKTVLDRGVPELVAMVEAGEMAVSAAAEIAKQPPEEQPAAIVAHNHRAQGTGENEWYTPAEYVEAARLVMGKIDLDPASSELANRTVQAERIFTLKDNGLEQEWSGKIWLNPPYAQPHIMNFAMKLVEEFKAGRVTEAIVLTHNYTDTAWFHAISEHAISICFTRGRIGFLSPEGARASPTQGQAFFYLGQNWADFDCVFRKFGLVMMHAQ